MFGRVDRSNGIATPLRLLRGGLAGGHVPPADRVASYTNRHRVTWYLHEVLSKDGHRRILPRKTITKGALAEMPEGYDFTENLAGWVGVKRMRDGRSKVPLAHLEVARTVLSWHPRLEGCIAERLSNGIMFHEPDPEPHPIEEELAGTEYSPAGYFHYHPHVRAAFLLRVADVPAMGAEPVYDALAPRSHYAIANWHVFDRGRVYELAVRHVPRLGLDVAIH